LIQQWIDVAMARLNSYEGSREWNSRKPWWINQYGILAGTGIKSIRAPDDFAEYGYNRLWWVFAHYVREPDPVNGGYRWSYPEWNRAGVPDLREFVEAGLGRRLP
jgi:hypothetical protein